MIAAEVSTRTPMSTGLVRSRDAQALALLHEPGGAVAPGRRDHGVGGEPRAVLQDHAGGAQVALAGGLLRQDAVHAAAGEHLDPGLQFRAHAREDVVGALGAHVADRRLDEGHPVEERLLADPVELLAAAVDLLRRAVLEPDAVDVVDELGEALLAHEGVEPAADVRRERELAVAEGAGAAPAAGDVAGLAAGADAGLARRAAAAADVGAALDDEHAAPLRRTSSSAAKIPAGPAPTTIAS